MPEAESEIEEKQPRMAEEGQIARPGDAFREEELELLYTQATLPIIASPLAAALLASAIWEVGDGVWLVAWVGIIASISLFRTALVVAFKKRRGSFALRTWERLFTSTVISSGLSWGVGGWLLLPETMAFRAVVFFFLVGMASAAVAVYAIHWAAAILTILALVLPTTLEFLLGDTLPERLMGLAAVLYVIAAYRSLRITDRFVQRFHSLSYELKGAKEDAELLARTDFLTGMNNRRSFYELCEASFKAARRYGHDLAAILFDIDQFKNINDAHGHAVGDEVLKSLSQIVADTCRRSDVAGRVGGEEFAILLPHTNAQSAHDLAERLRNRMEQSVVHLEGGDVKFTASFGVAQMPEECDSLDELVSMADGAMYRAKKRGRNGVFVVTPTAPQDDPL